MLLENTYKVEIDNFLAINHQRDYLQSLAYKLNKDDNVRKLFNLLKHYSKYSIEDMDESFRINIIDNNFAEELLELEKIVGIFFNIAIKKDTFLFEKDTENIGKCCRLFSDNIGQLIIKYICFYPIVSLYVQILNLYNNGNWSNDDKKMVSKKLKKIRNFFQVDQSPDTFILMASKLISNRINKNRNPSESIEKIIKSISKDKGINNVKSK